MFCRNCGAEIKEGTAFCAKCGSRLQTEGKPEIPKKEEFRKSEKTEKHEKRDQHEQQDREPGFGRGLMIGGITACVLLIAVIVVIFLFTGVFRKQRSDEDVEILEVAAGVGQSPEDDGTEEPLYHIEEVGMIDLDAENHAPGTKTAGMAWDKSLFYWLEDVDTLSSADGNIARCRVAKTFLKDSESGALIQYEIYSDPNNGEIYKIVSIQEQDGELELTDYYYVDGKPNFVFLRYDSVYTPTYATISKTGERFYFNSDVLVKWRMIQVPQEIEEYTLNPEDVWYPQADYFTEQAETQAAYDEAERRMLNRAYNTYEALAGKESTGLVEGRLLDTVGNPVAGAEVCIYRDSDNALMYRAYTGEDGRFGVYVYMDGTACRLYVKESPEYRESAVYGLALEGSASTFSYQLTMHKLEGDEYPVTLCAYPAMEIRTREGEHCLPVSGVTAYIREGFGAYQGDALTTLTADAEGMLRTNLISGTYTAQLVADGYQDTYLEFSVDEGAVEQTAYIIPGLEEGKTAIVLTWEGDGTDLDLTLFTPYQSTDGDMDHIGGRIAEDGHGNSLVSDNDRECEVVLANTGEPGAYKLYVNNYTDIQAGKYGSFTLLNLNVHIYIYNSSGFVADYTIPVGQGGVVWEAAEINGDTVMPGKRVYAEISGKSWWMEDKADRRLVKEIMYYSNGDTNVYNYEYMYDSSGNVTKKTAYYSDGTLAATVEYTYDSRGNLTEEAGFDGEEYAGSYTDYYDSQGRLVKEWLRYYGDIEYSYDSQGSLIKEIHYAWAMTGSDEASKWYDYYYDDQGNLTEKIQCVSADAGNIFNQEEYSYDALGNLTEMTIHRNGTDREQDYRYVYSYDARGNKTEEMTYHGDGKLDGWTEYCYDGWGNLTEEIRYSSDGSVTGRTEYIYE